MCWTEKPYPSTKISVQNYCSDACLNAKKISLQWILFLVNTKLLSNLTSLSEKQAIILKKQWYVYFYW